MKKILLFSSFLLLSAIVPVKAADFIAPDGVYLVDIKESPYNINHRLYLKPGSRIRADIGSRIDFGDFGGLCFEGEECLAGSSLFVDGIRRGSIIFESGAEVLVKEGKSDVSYRVKGMSFPDEPVTEMKRTIPFALFSLKGEPLSLVLVAGDRRYSLQVSLPVASDQNEYSGQDHLIDWVGVDKDFSCRQSGRIFIETEKNGEAWYVNPADCRRYFLGRPADAFSIMKKFGLGAKHEVLGFEVFPERLKGRILIDIEDKGKAYYIDVKNKKARYLGRPTDAFNLMVEYGVGISEADIRRIEIGKI